ncbi:MAG: CHAT domain-containing protein [Actinoplanes sp.]
MPIVTFRPKSLRAQRRGRRAFLAALIGFCLVCGLIVWFTGQSLHTGSPYAFWLRLIPAVASTAGSIAFVLLLAGDHRTERASTVAIAVCSAAGGAPLTYGVVRADFGLSLISALAVTAVESVAFGLVMLWWVPRNVRAMLRETKRPAAGADPDRAVEDAEQYGGNKVTLARALIRRSRADDLVRATDLLQAAATELPDSDVLMLFSAALDLVGAMDAKFSRSEDLTGYGEALHVLHTAVFRVPYDRDNHAAVAYANAEYLLAQFSVADEIAEKVLAGDAIRELDRARHLAGRAMLREFPRLHGTLAWLGWNTGELSADEAIAICREGQVAAGWSAWRRAPSDLMLATILLESGTPEAPADLGLAVRLFRRVIRTGQEGMRRDAWAGLAAAMADSGQWPPAEVATAWARAARESRTGPPTVVVQVSSDWVDWAERTGLPQFCAPAYQALMEAIPIAAGPHYQRGPKDRLLARAQNRAEEAGWWMLRAGDPAGAALALELGRAVAMQEITARHDPAVVDALHAAGRADLVERYRDAAGRLDLAERDLAPSDRFTSARQRASAGFEAVRREVDAIGLAEAPDYRLIRRAATEGPLVYLAAATGGGYAVIVRADGDPVPVALPELTRAAVRHAVDELERAGDGKGIERLAGWLWTAGMREVDRALGDGELVTLVPAGLLGLLPVHVASVRVDGAYRWQGLTDRNDFRYAPNARILRTSQARAAELGRTPYAVLAVAAPVGGEQPGQRPLDYVRPEVEAVAAAWRNRTGTVTVRHQATAGDLLDDLPRHTVWHLACHGHAAPDRILDSRLELADGPVSLRDLLRLPATVRRLAVLSSCESHRIGHELPDEVVGLPGGMLQLGLAGVVASHWEVNDRATALLMARFHDRCATGADPARALNEAQRWLRSASTAELRAAYPQLIGERSARFAHPYFWGAFTLTGA